MNHIFAPHQSLCKTGIVKTGAICAVGLGWLALFFALPSQVGAQARWTSPGARGSVFHNNAQGDDAPLPSPTGRAAQIGTDQPQSLDISSSDWDDSAFSPMRIEPSSVPRPLPKNSAFDREPSSSQQSRSAPLPPEIRPPTTFLPRRLDKNEAELHSPAMLPWKSVETVEHPAILPAVDQRELARILQIGAELEKEERWADALAHYTAALKIFYNDPDVLRHYRNARLHFEIGRRADDTSFLQMVQNTQQYHALQLYEQIITKIQNDYVDEPNWDQFFRLAIQDVEMALLDSVYRKQTGIAATPRQIEVFLEEMHTKANSWIIQNREDLKNGILGLALLAHQHIDMNPMLFLVECTCGIANSLDPFSGYLTPDKLSEQYSMISGNLVGLGLELRSDWESLQIVRIVEGSPAHLSGLHDGDRILAIDGVSLKGKDVESATELIQGQEGTVVRLLVCSAQEFSSAAREISITRKRFEIPSVEDIHMVNSFIGYAKLTCFQSRTAYELQRALYDLDRRGMQCLILDLRSNPGGLLQAGVDVADIFIESGPIVKTQKRNGALSASFMAKAENTWKTPLLVLIDEESASAAEIVAGAIRDHKRGVIIGKRSFGKGTIQAVLAVTSGQPGLPPAGLRLTVEKFFSPNDVPYSGMGVAPDITVETSQRVTLARPINGRLQIPIHSRTVSSAEDDPCIRQAIITAQEMTTRPR